MEYAFQEYRDIMRISVCIATYNGGRYISEQLDSILGQLSSIDEVLIVDDCSTDDTVKVIQAYDDPRIELKLNPANIGHTRTFSLALSYAQGEIIFMSDQDDIWLPNRVELMVNYLSQSNALLLSSNSIFVNSQNGLIEFKVHGVEAYTSNMSSRNMISIILGETNYYGCCMAIRQEFLKFILPIPNYVESHDLWIALGANMMGRNLHIDENTIRRRIHGNNASVVRRKLIQKIISRIIFLRSIITILSRKYTLS
jgi:glycosyltransferase involved in cell wall biosynthesis